MRDATLTPARPQFVYSQQWHAAAVARGSKSEGGITWYPHLGPPAPCKRINSTPEFESRANAAGENVVFCHACGCRRLG